MSGWDKQDVEVVDELRNQRQNILEAYRADPKLIAEHVGQEKEAGKGGYGRRQVFELVQNAADQLTAGSDRIQIVLGSDALYCANAGKPFSAAGAQSLLHAYVSEKGDEKIGKFGLGFKSVLGVTRNPIVLSQSASFRFGPDVAEVIRSTKGASGDLPILRIAEVFDPSEVLTKDGIAAELAEWATTIIKLPFEAEDASPWLSRDIAAFPAAFLAFAEDVGVLALDDRSEGLARQITADRTKAKVEIRDGDKTQTWLVFSREVEINEAAKKSVGTLGDHDNVTVKWAVSGEGASRLGGFWSYFPTDDETTLRGVLNAPWHLTPDRLRLIEGAYNQAILSGAARLVAGSLEDLRTSLGDPSSYLELLPARGREPRCWADGILSKETNELLAYEPSIPLVNGELGNADESLLHPSGVSSAALEIWASRASIENWVHHSVEAHKDRRARVLHYLEYRGKSEAALFDWFTALLDEETPEASLAAIKVAGELQRSSHPDVVDLMDVEFVCTEPGTMLAPNEPALMLPGKFEADQDGVVLVESSIAQDSQAVAALELLGVETVSADAEMRRLVTKAPPSASEEWDYFWRISRQVETTMVLDLIKKTSGFAPRLRTLAGEFRPVATVLLPGPCIPSDGSRDEASVIDLEWHREDSQLLRLLGCTDRPDPKGGSTDENWYQEYEDAAINEFLASVAPARPSKEAVQISKNGSFPGPMSVMRVLSDEGMADFCRLAFQPSGSWPSWTVEHRNTKYKPISFPNPAIWMVLEEGYVATSIGPRRPASCVAPQLRAGELCPALEGGQSFSDALKLPETWGQVDPEIIAEVLGRALEAPPEDAAELYSELVVTEGIEPPAKVRCTRHGEPDVAAPGRVAVCGDGDLARLFEGGDACVLEVADADKAQRLISHWGMIDAAGLVSKRVAYEAEGDPLALVDVYPPLKRLLSDTNLGLSLQRCSEIRNIEEAEGGTRSVDVLCVVDGDRLLCDSSLSDRRAVAEIGRVLGLDLNDQAIDAVLNRTEAAKVTKFRKAVRKAPTLQDKLVQLLGESELHKHLPRSVLDAYATLHGHPDEQRLAQLALSVHGVEVLQVHREAITERGIDTPHHWAGSRPAREFVRSLGFPEEYAGFAGDQRPRELVVEGRPDLPDLHEYQQVITVELRALLGEEQKNRAMISLPTGSGKTRVAIEGAVEALRDRLLERPLLLWVAQTDELCEQAVQSWDEIWRARGLQDRLTINRLWGSNEAEPAQFGVQVVVATIAKLQNVVEAEEYEWLSLAGAVFIDEAHGSTSPSYGKLFKWLGLDRLKIGSPLVGLTATPYKGNEDESKRLANMYGGNRLDVIALGEGDHYPKLQEQRIISRVQHQTLEGGEVKLTDAEMGETAHKGLLPKAADRRLGEDVQRTKRILESISSLPDTWPILVFAPSVENSQALAGLLNHQGISAAAISGETPRQARRWYIDQFRDGELRVITNYNVLAEGFDAPAVRAVYIARPVYAANRYQQMVGRGLRGELNGGKADCLIVDVEDNVINFEKKLAFHDFDYLWNPETVLAANA